MQTRKHISITAKFNNFEKQYETENFLTGIIGQVNDSVGFTKNGVINPRNITWSGEMALQRIGDLLPFEYEPKSK